MLSWLLGRRAAQLAQMEMRIDHLARTTERLSADLEHLEALAVKVRSRVTGAMAARRPAQPEDVNQRILRGEFPTATGGI